MGRHLVSPPCKNLGSLAALRQKKTGARPAVVYLRLAVFQPSSTGAVLLWGDSLNYFNTKLFDVIVIISVRNVCVGGYDKRNVNSCATKWVAIETHQQQVESEWSPSCKCCVAMRQYLVAVQLCNHGDGNGGGKSCGVFVHCCWFKRPHSSDNGDKF